MRFRITHLLVAAVAVALFAIALANPSSVSCIGTGFGVWLIYLVIACRAFLRAKERPVLFSAVTAGVSFIWAAERCVYDVAVLASIVRKTATLDNELRGVQFLQIGVYGLSLLVALIAGALGAYWSRTKNDAQ